jgi:hypothetical protein
MDLRTGKTYPSAEEALAAGVPASDIVDARTGKPFRRERHPEPSPNTPQGKRERGRRLRQLAGKK